MYVREEFVNKTENYVFGDTGIYATRFESVKEIFRFALAEYGRCSGSIFIDTDEGTQKIGWSFEKKIEYSDGKTTYVREVWVTLHTAKADKRVEYHPMCIK